MADQFRSLQQSVRLFQSRSHMHPDEGDKYKFHHDLILDQQIQDHQVCYDSESTGELRGISTRWQHWLKLVVMAAVRPVVM